MLLRSRGPTRGAAPRGGGRKLVCALVGVGVALVGGTPTGAGLGCDHRGATLCGPGPQRALSWLCHSGGVDRITRGPETHVAWGMVAPAAPSTGGRTTALRCDWLG